MRDPRLRLARVSMVAHAAAAAAPGVYPSARGAGVAATGMIGLARMMKGSHWPLDILCWLVVGTVASAFAAAMLKLSRHAAETA